MIDLTHYITSVFRELHDEPDVELLAAKSAGRHARRLGMSLDELSRWLQSAYGSIWVREMRLRPSYDLKEIRQVMIKAYGKPQRLNISDHDSKTIEKWVPGARKLQDEEMQRRDEWHRLRTTPGTAEYEYHQRLQRQPMPEWEQLEGQWILRIPGRSVAALPTTGKRNATRFVIFDINSREEITQVRKDEVRAWLIAESRREKD